MSVLQFNQVSVQFDSGDMLFENISCNLPPLGTGLVGRNGVGKSIFAQLAARMRQPTSGNVLQLGTLGYFQQQENVCLDPQLTIAQYLGIAEIIDAIEQITAGNCAQALFDLVADRWNLESEISEQLHEIGVPSNINMPCHLLSGGQLARLRLWQLFNQAPELLILDEPSNHLDRQGKQWLTTQLACFQGHLLLISHDRQLLRQMAQIWELTDKGINQYGGNYDVYYQQKALQNSAVERELNDVKKAQKQLLRQTQKSREKAAQRASKGIQIRQQGGQPKMALDARKEQASASAAQRQKRDARHFTQLNEKVLALRAKHNESSAVKIRMQQQAHSTKPLVNLVNVVLPFGSKQPINLALCANQKIHLQGVNGSGKSTLLKTIANQWAVKSGDLLINASCYYLDQHFNLLNNNHSVLANVTYQCPNLSETQARTLLAGIGFRKDKVLMVANTLSGGEKMKVAMLIAGHQRQAPLLLLDEPDNHLDIDAKLALANTLKNYQGALLLVSHDQDFIDDCCIEQSLTLDA